MRERSVYCDEQGRIVLRLPAGGSNERRTLEQALALTQTRTGLDFSDARIRAGFGRGHLLDLVVYSRAAAHGDTNLVHDACTELVANLVGEATFANWIDNVESALLPRRSSLPVLNGGPREQKPTLAAAELPSTVDAAIRAVLEQLPEAPCCERADSAEWTMFELESQSAPDYAAQDDLLLATTMLPEMLKCYLRGAPFYSGRFSRAGETFCYLKYEDAPALSAEQRVAKRRALEDVCNELLIRRKLGCVIGNGLGVRYSYLDFALTDLKPALSSVRECLRSADVPASSWLLFCDSSLAEDWVGIWDDRVPPHQLG